MNNCTTRKLLGALLAAAAIAAPTTALSDWTGNIEGGTVIQGDTKGAKLRLNVSNNDRPFNQAFYVDYITDTTSKTTGFEFGYKPKYWFSDQTYAFGDGSLRTGASKSIDQVRKLFVGVGIQLINTESSSMFGELGAGQTQTLFEKVEVNGIATTIPDESSTSTLARVGATQTLSDLFKLEFDANYTILEKSVQTGAEAGASFRIPGGAIKYSYRFKSTEPDGLEAVETTDSFVSFTYGF